MSLESREYTLWRLNPITIGSTPFSWSCNCWQWFNLEALMIVHPPCIVSQVTKSSNYRGESHLESCEEELHEQPAIAPENFMNAYIKAAHTKPTEWGGEAIPKNGCCNHLLSAYSLSCFITTMWRYKLVGNNYSNLAGVNYRLIGS